MNYFATTYWAAAYWPTDYWNFTEPVAAGGGLFLLVRRKMLGLT
jgi:hypothetical protein